MKKYVSSRILRSMVLKSSRNKLAVFAVGYFEAVCTGPRGKGWQRMALALKNEPGARVVCLCKWVPVSPGSENPSSSRISMAVVLRGSLSTAFWSSSCLCKQGILYLLDGEVGFVSEI